VTGYSYCPHDEGERCDCATEIAVRKTYRPAVTHAVPVPACADGRSGAARQAEVARHAARGLSAAAIAAATGLHLRTVERHLARIKRAAS